MAPKLGEVFITVAVDSSVKDALKAYAKNNKVLFSGVVNAALAEFLQAHAKGVKK